MAQQQPVKGPSQRQLRVGELLRHALADMILRDEIRDDAFTGVIITVAEIKVSPDLKQATAFVQTTGASDPAVVISALNRHQKYIRGVLARRLDLRFAPEVQFRIDVSLDRAARVDELLRSPGVARDLD